MPRRSSMLQLPDEIRERLNARLVQAGFSNYDVLLDWLNDQIKEAGIELRISRTALWRHGKKFEDRLEKMRVATEQAKALSEGSDDDQGDMNEALIRLVQTQTFEILMELGDEPDPAALNKIGLMVARLTRASVKVKEWRNEVREELERKTAAAAEKVAALAGKSGLSPSVASQIRAEILGIKVDG